MSDTSRLPPRRRPPAFTPRFTIGLFYLAAFFFLFSFLQVLPDLLRLLSEMQPGPAQQQAAAELTREGSSPLVSLALALLATMLGSWLEVLPGLRRGA